MEECKNVWPQIFVLDHRARLESVEHSSISNRIDHHRPYWCTAERLCDTARGNASRRRKRTQALARTMDSDRWNSAVQAQVSTYLKLNRWMSVGNKGNSAFSVCVFISSAWQNKA